MWKKASLYKGILIMLISALAACLGQMFWKIFVNQDIWPFFVVGLILYGMGALLMLCGMRFGEFSVLHPMQGSGYIWSVVLGALVLREAITVSQIIGVLIILIGLILLGLPERNAVK